MTSEKNDNGGGQVVSVSQRVTDTLHALTGAGVLSARTAHPSGQVSYAYRKACV